MLRVGKSIAVARHGAKAMTQKKARQKGVALSEIGPQCAAGDTCEHRVFLEEYKRVDRDFERSLVAQLAAARVRLNELEAEVLKLRDPEEEREDGTRVSKDRWQSGIRNIVTVLGLERGRGTWEIDDVVEEVRRLKKEEV